MGLDIRIPIGLMFALLGAVLIISGFAMDAAVYERSLGINVNLWWGLVLLVFGVLMFLFGRRGSATAKPTEESPEGRKIEEFEHRLGLEEEKTTEE